MKHRKYSIGKPQRRRRYFLRRWVALSTIIAVLVTATVLSDNTTKQTGPESPNQDSSQLADVNKKIEQLPELEKDIFTKCMDGKEGTSSDIKTCQEQTQKEIFTLSQDLSNLKQSLQN